MTHLITHLRIIIHYSFSPTADIMHSSGYSLGERKRERDREREEKTGLGRVFRVLPALKSLMETAMTVGFHLDHITKTVL